MRKYGISLAGCAAGAVNGFFGSGGGMVLVPLLGRTGRLPEEQILPGSLRIMLPICLTSLILGGKALPWGPAFPYLLGSLAGGCIAAAVCGKLPVRWLRRWLGLLILLGGVRLVWR